MKLLGPVPVGLAVALGGAISHVLDLGIDLNPRFKLVSNNSPTIQEAVSEPPFSIRDISTPSSRSSRQFTNVDHFGRQSSVELGLDGRVASTLIVKDETLEKRLYDRIHDSRSLKLDEVEKLKLFLDHNRTSLQALKQAMNIVDIFLRQVERRERMITKLLDHRVIDSSRAAEIRLASKLVTDGALLIQDPYKAAYEALNLDEKAWIDQNPIKEPKVALAELHRSQQA